ncbi:WYL domain-containing protein [Serpentinimonas raichei]|uniref:WYL domain-containing protein n=1 Tax=Serpentinimonas raichei TaxID=1458425 RepID=UPI001184E962|nr:WYL domain-containing protein [Serpentinimonas raichei]
MILDDLLKAIENGATLRIRYFGGSSAGSESELQPISVNDGELRALCTLSGETKTFVIDKMELVIEGVASVLAAAYPPPVLLYPTVNEFAAFHTASLQEQGWEILHEGQSLTLHRKLKNGKLIQNPDVALQFEAVTHDAIFDGEKFLEANHRDRSRPWIVRAKNKNTKTFGDFGRAQVTFLEFAKALAPKTLKQNAYPGSPQGRCAIRPRSASDFYDSPPVMPDSNAPTPHWSYPSMKELVEAEGAPFSAYFCFHYLSSQGERTIRTVRSTHVLFTSTEAYLVAHCELRNEKRVFRSSQVTNAHLLNIGTSLTNLPSWLRAHAPAHRTRQSKDPVVRETGTGYMAINTSRGLIHLSSQIYVQALNGVVVQPESESVNFLLERLPALSHDLALEIVQKLFQIHQKLI